MRGTIPSIFVFAKDTTSIMEKEEDKMPKWAIGLVCFSGLGTVIVTASLLKSWSKRKDRAQKADIKLKAKKQKQKSSKK